MSGGQEMGGASPCEENVAMKSKQGGVFASGVKGDAAKKVFATRKRMDTKRARPIESRREVPLTGVDTR